MQDGQGGRDAGQRDVSEQERRGDPDWSPPRDFEDYAGAGADTGGREADYGEASRGAYDERGTGGTENVDRRGGQREPDDSRSARRSQWREDSRDDDRGSHGEGPRSR